MFNLMCLFEVSSSKMVEVGIKTVSVRGPCCHRAIPVPWNVWTELWLRAISGSVVLQQLESVLMSVPHIITGHYGRAGYGGLGMGELVFPLTSCLGVRAPSSQNWPQWCGHRRAGLTFNGPGRTAPQPPLAPTRKNWSHLSPQGELAPMAWA